MNYPSAQTTQALTLHLSTITHANSSRDDYAPLAQSPASSISVLAFYLE